MKRFPFSLAVLPFTRDESKAAAQADKIIADGKPSIAVSTECAGSNRVGVYHNAVGQSVTELEAKSDILFEKLQKLGVPTISIGDLGNEMGLGAIGEHLNRYIPYAAPGRCSCGCGEGLAVKTKADFLITATVSNWGCYGMIAALAFLKKDIGILQDGELEKETITAASRSGMVNMDGSLTPAVDGFSVKINVLIVELMRECVSYALDYAHFAPGKTWFDKVLELGFYGGDSMPKLRILPAGDCCLTVEFGNAISEEINGRVLALEAALNRAGLRGVVETVPTYRSLLVCYDPCAVRFSKLSKQIMRLCKTLGGAASAARRVIEIPVCYGGACGEDLPGVAAHTGLSEAEVVRLHSSRDYLIYMLGFLPGFAYLGGMDPKLATPRLKTPRTKIPAGSVAIGGEQTGIYPMPSPGGWRLIGSTPVKPYDPNRKEPILYRAGDYIRFIPITAEQYGKIEAQVADGTYLCKVREGGIRNGN